MAGTISIQLQKTSHTLVTEGIIKVLGKESSYIEREDAIKMREANLKLSNNKPFCVLMDCIGSYYTFSPEAKQLLACPEYCQLRKATAFVVNSLSVRMMVSFFINVNKPASPTQIFACEETAINWLKTFSLK